MSAPLQAGRGGNLDFRIVAPGGTVERESHG
jgi:hypothetical protein